MANVVMTPHGQAGFNALPRTIQIRVLRILQELPNWPDVSGCKPLRGKLAGHYRKRTGDYRIQFFVTGKAPNDTVAVERIGHRDGFYDD